MLGEAILPDCVKYFKHYVQSTVKFAYYESLPSSNLSRGVGLLLGVRIMRILLPKVW